MVLWGVLAHAQVVNRESQAKPQAPPSSLKQPLSQKQSTSVPLQAEAPFYKKWVSEDVRWIITDEELAAWKKLKSNAERDAFMEAFWQRRDPTPDTEENEYKEEHYRRIMYANEHFAAGVPGWRTDRGRMYIMYGKPDAIDSHPTGGPAETVPFEVWRYRYMEGIGQEIEIQFDDPCRCGEYHLTLDRSKKDILPQTPNVGLNANDVAAYVKPNPPLQVKFKDLQAVVDSKVNYSLLPVDVRVDFVRVTSDTVLVPISIQVPNQALTFVNQRGVQRATVNIFGRITTLAGKPVETFEEPLRLDVPPELLEKVLKNVALYWRALAIRPGHYRLVVVVKDANGDKLGTVAQSLVVPEYPEEKLASSTLILADVMEPVPSREGGTGNFVLGTMKVRPRVPPADGKPANFPRNQTPKVNFWMQVYNLTFDERTKRPSATIEYLVVNATTNRPVVDLTENTDELGNISDQLTLQKSLPTSKLEPGLYQITIKVNDLVSKQAIAPTAWFTIE
jgi:GWxTD domain-containing protein